MVSEKTLFIEESTICLILSGFAWGKGLLSIDLMLKPEQNTVKISYFIILYLYAFFPQQLAGCHGLETSHSSPSHDLRGGELPHAQALPRPFRTPEIVLQLLLEPTLGGGVERDRQANRHFGTDAGPSVEDGRQRVPAHVQRCRSLGDGQLQGHQAEFTKDLSGVRRVVHANSRHQ